MKLIIAIVQSKDANSLVDSLTEEGFMVTKMASTGGFLKSGNTTLLVGVEEDEVDKVISNIKERFKDRKKQVQVDSSSGDTTKGDLSKKEIKVGGATIFVIDVNKFKKI